jgi:uncharacterized tellurite resistance protein B-like protein
MFADLFKRLSAPAHPAPQDDLRLALAALLVRVARADGAYTADEVARIDKILAARHSLSDADAAQLRTQAEALEADAPDTVRFTRAIKDTVPLEDREAVIEALWAVVLADGMRDDDEDTFLRMTANLLGINDRDSNLARQRVAARLQS